ncbi:zeta toxin family protein [Roseimaritima sediminicola]|uniref:zeta toxin family protein n=1 Tax=Roseimaritima sediminicola TaxID=2662066 RepID=UPI0012983296|nr:zeta toxin family protein [Roseimaritima sediminicola]
MSRWFAFLDQRPIVIAIAGSNGAGKSTFYEAFLADCGLRFINADVIAAALEISSYEAAEVAAAMRTVLVNQRESFVFETVLSDPVGEKVDQLVAYASLGYTVALIFIELDSVEESIRRVSMRVSQGGHDVPDEKLRGRFDRTRANLQRAIERLPHVLVYNNEDLSHPYRLVAAYDHGVRVDS